MALQAVPLAGLGLTAYADGELPASSAGTAAVSSGEFTANDYSAERSTVTKHVEFEINKAESLIYFAGADSERYMDVFKSSGGTWYGYESNYKHLLASVKEPTGTAPEEPEEPVSGDYNGDGKLTVADAVMYARFIGEDTTLTNAQLDSILKAEPDQNNDGLMTILDMTAILKKLENK